MAPMAATVDTLRRRPRRTVATVDMVAPVVLAITVLAVLVDTAPVVTVVTAAAVGNSSRIGFDDFLREAWARAISPWPTPFATSKSTVDVIFISL